MKKIYSLLVAFSLVTGYCFSQCVINASAQTTPGANPTAANLPCIVIGQPYDQTIQGQIQTNYDSTITLAGFSVTGHFRIDSLRIDSIKGLPAGVSYNLNPLVLPGGGNGCIQFTTSSGTGPTGRYQLTAWGTVWTRVTAQILTYSIDTPFVYRGQLNNWSPFGNYYLDVINSGEVCHPTGINDFSADLNAAFMLLPNPSTGIFEFKLNAGNRVNGDIIVIDLSGKRVFSQALDVVGLYSTKIDLSTLPKGIYTVQLRTAEGFASKNVSIE